jgi:hypothetical protein
VKRPEQVAGRSVKKNVYQCSAGKLGKLSRLSENNIKMDLG